MSIPNQEAQQDKGEGEAEAVSPLLAAGVAGHGCGPLVNEVTGEAPSWEKVVSYVLDRLCTAQCSVMLLQSLQLGPWVSLWVFLSLLMPWKCHWFGCLVSGLVI